MIRGIHILLVTVLLASSGACLGDYRILNSKDQNKHIELIGGSNITRWLYCKVWSATGAIMVRDGNFDPQFLDEIVNRDDAVVTVPATDLNQYVWSHRYVNAVKVTAFYGLVAGAILTMYAAVRNPQELR